MKKKLIEIRASIPSTQSAISSQEEKEGGGIIMDRRKNWKDGEEGKRQIGTQNSKVLRRTKKVAFLHVLHGRSLREMKLVLRD